MTKKIKLIAIGIVAVFALFALYRLFLIRTVNYEIAGVRIPSEYNVLTGSVRPILDYKGKAALPSMPTRKADKLGLSKEQVMVAQLRWAVFEQWVNQRAEYKGWDSDPVLFKKAHDAFREELKSYPKAVVIE